MSNVNRLAKEAKAAVLESADYKNIDLLKQHILETGRIIPSRVSRTDAKFQRRVTHAIKVARFLALLPYCDSHK